MNVIIQINVREAIPVRAIPLLTNWRFMSPDIVAHVLGGTGGSNVSLFGDLESYRVENGQVRPINKDWWVQFPLKKLRALSKKIKEAEPIDEVGYSTWQELSLEELPAGVFVWKDDYKKLHDENWNHHFRMTYCALKDWNGEESDEEVEGQTQRDLARDLRRDDLVDDNPLKRDLRESLEVLKRWREPDYCPFMEQGLGAIVMEGFEVELVKRMVSAEQTTAVIEIENVERLWRDAKQSLELRQETLKNAPGTGEIQKLKDAEQAVQLAEKAMADAKAAHKLLRGDLPDETQQAAPMLAVGASAGVEPASDGPAPEPIDFDMLATRQQLIGAFGSFTGMTAAWFVNLRDTPALLAARKIVGTGGNHPTEPLFCPYEVMVWLVDTKRRKGRKVESDTAWRMLESHFPRVYARYSVGDTRTA